MDSLGFDHVVETIGRTVEGAGVAVMVVGIAIAFVLYVRDLVTTSDRIGSYRGARHHIGRSILLGLELLVAGDIIRTVAVSPTFTSVGVLAIIVAIRSFLAMTLEMEIEGRWPWQRAERPTAR